MTTGPRCASQPEIPCRAHSGSIDLKINELSGFLPGLRSIALGFSGRKDSDPPCWHPSEAQRS